MIHVIHIYIFFMLENDNTSQQTTGQAWTRIHSMPHFIFIADCIKADLVALQSFYSADLRIYHWNRNLQHIRRTILHLIFNFKENIKLFCFHYFEWILTYIFFCLRRRRTALQFCNLQWKVMTNKTKSIASLHLKITMCLLDVIWWPSAYRELTWLFYHGMFAL